MDPRTKARVAVRSLIPVAALAALILTSTGCQRGDAHNKHTGGHDASPQATADPNAPAMIRANPNVPNLPFTNQDGETVHLSDLKGKPVLMSFIYTRCPMPTMCPLTTKQFVNVQNQLSAAEKQATALVLLSFDPEYDTPEVLRRYGVQYGVDLTNLSLWTGDKQNVFDLTDSYNMWYKAEDGEYAHRTFSVVLDAEGKYVSDLRGADWDPKAAVELLRSLIPNKG